MPRSKYILSLVPPPLVFCKFRRQQIASAFPPSQVRRVASRGRRARTGPQAGEADRKSSSYLSPKMRIACLQFNPQVSDVDNNMTRADRVLAKGNPENLDLLVLPEMAFSGKRFLICTLPGPQRRAKPIILTVDPPRQATTTSLSQRYTPLLSPLPLVYPPCGPAPPPSSITAMWP